MNLPEEEKAFLCELVKVSRQKTHHIEWVDRDGTERITTMTIAEHARVNKLAHGLGVSKGEVLRQAAHIPVKK